MATPHPCSTIYTRNLTETEDTLAHSRNLSTLSSATLFTNTTSHSQPTEPLLPQPHGATAYFENIEHLSRHPDGTPARIHVEGPPYDEPVVVREKQRRYLLKVARRRKWIALILQVYMILWAAYNAVRYFLAFTIYDSSLGQTYALALGISAGLAFALGLCSLGLEIKQRNTIIRNPTLKYTTTILQYLSSLCFLTPAVVNFALVFVLKESADVQFGLEHRCHIDIDLVWAITANLCNTYLNWRLWIVFSSVRLALTLLIAICYHVLSPPWRSYPTRPMLHRHLSGSYSTTPNTTAGLLSSSLSTPGTSYNPSAQRQVSDSTISVTSRGDASTLNTSQLRLVTPRSSGLSSEASPELGVTRRVRTETEEETELNGFPSFRSILSQIDQETEDALDFAQSDHAATAESVADTPRDAPPSYEGDYDDDEYHEQGHVNPNNVFNLPPIHPALGYNEFGLPYPPDENVRVLNGYIRRMPTIESMGSGEVNGSLSASSHRAEVSLHSRPPTRNTLASWTSTDYDAGSQPPSRPNSLSARAEQLAALSAMTSEVGELLGRSEVTMRRVPSPCSFLEQSVAGGDSYSVGTTDSHGTTGTSYHTATMGSTVDSMHYSSSLGEHRFQHLPETSGRQKPS